MKLSRVLQENSMLEDRNTMLVTHLQHSSTCPSSPTDLMSPGAQVRLYTVELVNSETSKKMHERIKPPNKDKITSKRKNT